MVLNTTFNNISVISWQSVLLVEEAGVPGENQRPVAIFFTSPLTGFELTILVVIDTDCTGSCKSNYHMIITRQPPLLTEDNKYFAGNI